MSLSYQHNDHFNTLAPQYHLLRTIDEEPVTHLATYLTDLPAVQGADIGCGNGRYTSLFLEHLREKNPRIYSVDYSMEMLEQSRQYFSENGQQAARTINASAMRLPLKSDAFNCTFAFNAIHHFALPDFFSEIARVLQKDGYLFIYTRLRSQNNSHIWGLYFPSFTSQKTGLYELNELENSLLEVPALRMIETRIFKFHRKSNLEMLLSRARNRHYCTFNLYTPEELETATQQFAGNVMEHFDDPEDIRWEDEYTLVTLKKM